MRAMRSISRPSIWPTFPKFGITSSLRVLSRRLIPFDVGQVIEDAILHNRDAKMNLGHPFLIFGLCKQAGVPLDDNEVWLHPIKAISVKRDTPGVPQPEGVYDSGHEPSDEDELPDYRARFGFLGDTQDDLGQSSSHPPPP